MPFDTSVKGWDLIYKLIENDLNRKEDVLIAFIHLILINDDFRCIGLGDDISETHNKRVLSGKEKSSELLPPHWNLKDTSYELRYVKDGKLYILRADVNQDIIINFVEVPNLVITSVAFNLVDTVKLLKGDSIEELIPNYDTVMKKIKIELIKCDPSKDTTTQTLPEQEHICEVIDTKVPAIPTHRSIQVDTIDLQSRFGNFDYGNADIYPVYTRRGGMIFNPIPTRDSSTNPDLGMSDEFPGTSIIPSARFDAVTPTPDNVRRRLRLFPPDADAMPPDYENT